MTNFHVKKVRDCYIFHTFLLVIILLLIITIICYHYAKQKGIIQNGNSKVCIKQSMCYYFDDIINLEDFDLDNISINKNHMKVF